MTEEERADQEQVEKKFRQTTPILKKNVSWDRSMLIEASQRRLDKRSSRSHQRREANRIISSYPPPLPGVAHK